MKKLNKIESGVEEMKKTLSILVLTVLILGSMSFVAFAQSYTIGMVAAGLGAEINATYYNSVQRRLNELGHKFMGAVADNDDERFISGIENMIQANVDAIIIGWGNTEAYRNVIKQAEQAGIPVVGIYAGLVDGMVFDVGSNDFAMSSMVSKYMADRLRAQGGGDVALIFSDDQVWGRARKAALMAVLTEYPDVNIVAEHAINWNNVVEDAISAGQNILLANPSVKAFWGVFDLPVVGIAQSLMGMGRDDVFVVGIDGDPETLEMIAHTNVYGATVRQQPELIGETTATLLVDYLNGEWKPVAGTVDIEAILVTPSNVHEFID